MPLKFEKPTGTRDTLPGKLKLIRRIANDIESILEKWGYEEVETPLLEYHQTVGLFSKIPDDKLIKFLDPVGKTVILRPDFTTPIARLAASIYKDVNYPIRLMYQGKVCRNLGSRGVTEVNQIGMELLGLDSLEGDAEVITLAVQTISKCTDAKFKVAVGHTKFLRLLLKQIGCGPLQGEGLFQALLDHDYVGYKNLVTNLDINDTYKDYLLRMLKMRGSYADIAQGQTWFDSIEWQEIFKELSELWAVLSQYQVTEYVSLDLSLVGRQNYYTGMIYHVYCEGHPYPICSGGRYDNLIENFGRPGTATGFAINIDDLVSVVNSNLGENEQEKVLLLYTLEKRTQAIQLANDLRLDEKIVVMAEKGTILVEDQNGFTQIIEL